MLRNDISPTHPVFGDDYVKLPDDAKLEPGDETACVSCLLSEDGDEWVLVTDYEFDGCIGKTVAFACDETGDADGDERVFRRKRTRVMASVCKILDSIDVSRESSTSVALKIDEATALARLTIRSRE